MAMNSSEPDSAPADTLALEALQAGELRVHLVERGPTLKTRDGRTVKNLLCVFDSCFDTT